MSIWQILLVVVIGIVMFVIWLAGPVSWRDGEGDIREDGKKLARRMSRFPWWP